MCGIVGYVGKRENCVPFLLEGLRRLEYRGYDSAGIAVVNHEGLKVVKKKGYLDELSRAVDRDGTIASTGIGHTRWATHGEPTDENAHPHLACDGTIAVVHNGIIENYKELKKELRARGHVFTSQTDTEVIAHLIEENYTGDLLAAVLATLERLSGSFAIAAISTKEPDVLVAARHDSPLIVGIGDSEFFVASDIPAVLKETRKVVVVEDGEIVKASREGLQFFTFDGRMRHKSPVEITWDAEAAEKGGFEDFMLKEIFEQPQAIINTLRGRIKDCDVDLSEMKLSDNLIKDIERVVFLACGTSHYAAMVGRNAIEMFAKIPCDVEVSSEFRYRPMLIDGNVLVVAISQSGETADTLVSMRRAKAVGFPVLAIPNVVGSTAAREATGVLFTHAGPEIGVAATKTMSAQIVALFLLALHIARVKGAIPYERRCKFINELEELPSKVETVLSRTDRVKELAEKYHTYSNFLFLGRTHGLPAAYEGALKLKEITYIHAEAYPAGEMKHGPIALIDENMPVVFIATQGDVYDKIISNMEEVKARKGKIIAIATDGDEKVAELADDVIYVPWTFEAFTPLLAIVPLQLLTYYIGKLRGVNVDRPRNLAKSVTVE
jgi:glucosamine--fructose-6-phosphate aminotransferase (isomerizing)